MQVYKLVILLNALFSSYLCTKTEDGHLKLVPIQKNYSELVGNNFSIACYLESKELLSQNNIDWEWRLNGILLNESDNVEIKFEGKNSTLNLKNLSREQTGELECIAKNKTSNNNATEKFDLQIIPLNEAKPNVTVDREHYIATSGGFLSINCTMEAGFDQNIFWQWKSNDVLLKNDSRIEITLKNNNKTSILTIRKLNVTIRKISCAASNKFGSDTKEIKTVVKSILDLLWPYLIVVGESLILSSIIIFFERRFKGKKSQENELSQNLVHKQKYGDVDNSKKDRIAQA